MDTYFGCKPINESEQMYILLMTLDEAIYGRELGKFEQGLESKWYKESVGEVSTAVDAIEAFARKVASIGKTEDNRLWALLIRFQDLIMERELSIHTYGLLTREHEVAVAKVRLAFEDVEMFIQKLGGYDGRG
jgi:hypothetical protein